MNLPANRRLRQIVYLAAVVLVAVGGYFISDYSLKKVEQPGFCPTCHEIRPQYIAWTFSAHSQINCLTCHGGDNSTLKRWARRRIEARNALIHVFGDPKYPFKQILTPPNHVCGQCHSPNREVTPSGDLIIPHREHTTVTGTACAACHVDVVHARAAKRVEEAVQKTGGKRGEAFKLLEKELQNLGPKERRPLMGACMGCHNGKTAPSACAACHFKHASDLRRLLAGQEENLCFKCHDTTANSMSGRNIKNEFSVTRASYHDIYGERTGGKVECSSCHGPHTVGAKSLSVSDTTYSQVANPDNTKSVMARVYAVQDNGIGNTVGTFTTFCIKCHDGSPPTATESTTEYVPYTIVFPSTSFTTNSGGWNKSAYTGKSHDSASTPILCTDCHESHGSDYPLLQKYTEDSDIVYGECCRCHRTGGDVVATDVYTDLVRTYRHPTLYISGKHSDTENYNNMPLADRHAECADCHDPHRCDSTTAVAPAVYGSIKGVSGVSINYGTSSFTSWPGDATFSLKLGIDYQYELCFKCHSYYSFGTNRPTWPSRPSRKLTDQAKEFNPNNPAYHAVVGESKIPTFSYGGQTYYCGKFVSPWTATSRLYCTDCHGSDSSGVRGSHGSAQKSILRAPWEWNTTSSYEDGTGGKDTNSTGHLCFNCHDKAFYDDGTDKGSETVRSKFGNWYEAPPNKWNFHAQHPDVACSACHGAVPHGFKNRGILVETSDEAPYKAPSFLDILTFPNPGQWKCSYCNHT